MNEQIALEPIAWYVATWRRLPALSRPVSAAFDLETCAARVARLTGPGGPSWDRVALPVNMSREEARFWFDALSRFSPEVQPRTYAIGLARQFDGRPLARTEIVSRLRRNRAHVTPHIVLPLAHLFSTGEVIDLAASDDLSLGETWHAAGLDRRLNEVFRQGIQRYLVPYLGQEDLAALRERLRPRCEEAAAAGHPGPSPAIYLAAALGMSPEVAEYLSHWPDNHFADRREPLAQWLVFGLGSPEAVRAEMRRLGLRLVEPAHVRAWLAHTELSDLDFVRESILASPTKGEASRLIEELEAVQAAEATSLFLDLKLHGKAPQIASRWLGANTARTVAGLSGVAAGRGKAATAALTLLRDLARDGHGRAVEEQLEQLDPSVAGRLRKALADAPATVSTPFDPDTAPSWLLVATQEQLGGRPTRLPGWLSPRVLPNIRLGAYHLDATQVHAVVNALRQSTLKRPAPLVRLLGERAERGSLEEFGWQVFQRWLDEGGKAADRWALEALGHWGGDATAVRLGPLVRAWPGQAQHRRATHGLEVLRAIGTDTALLELSAIARSGGRHKLGELAQVCMLDVAQERGLSPARLEDRIVPTLGLDEAGRSFDYGTRQFRLVMGTDLKARVRDEAGKVRAGPPPPAQRDDPVKAHQALAEWKRFKKQLREVLRAQGLRLEAALLSGRRWPSDEFRAWIVPHPIMGRLARSILWAGFDAAGRFARVFRIDEDGAWVDRDEAPCPADGLVSIGIVHPLHLDDDERRAWQRALDDHELLPPFPQLSRPLYRLEGAEIGASVLHRAEGVQVPTISLVSLLDRNGWDRGRPVSNGHDQRNVAHLKYFPSIARLAVLRYEPGVPVYLRRLEIEQPQTLRDCFFVAEGAELAQGIGPADAVPLGSIDPVVMCEVLAVLRQLASKAV